MSVDHIIHSNKKTISENIGQNNDQIKPKIYKLEEKKYFKLGKLVLMIFLNSWSTQMNR